VIRSKDRDGVHAQTGEDTSCRPGRAAGRGGESVHEVNASDHGLREEALLVQGGRGLDERPASPAAQVQPGCGTAVRDGCPLDAERVEPELAGVAVGPGKLPLPVHRADRDHGRRVEMVVTEQLPVRHLSSIPGQAIRRGSLAARDGQSARP
jgi:hypothetical protein